MTGKQQEKTVTIRSSAGTEREEHRAVVRPGETPRSILARTVGQEDEMLLRTGPDGYLQPDDDVHARVRDGEQVYAGKNPVVG